MKLLLIFSQLGLSFALLAHGAVAQHTQELAQLDTARGVYRVHLLNSLAAKYIGQHTDSSKLFAAQALSLAEQLADRQGMLESLNQLGNLYQRMGLLDSATLYYERKIPIATSDSNFASLAHTYNNIAIIHTSKGSYDSALMLYLKALDYEYLCDTVDQLGVAQSYMNIAVVHFYMGNANNCTGNMRKATQMAEALGNDLLLSQCANNLGAIYEHYGQQPDSAIFFYRKAMRISQKLNEKHEMAINLSNLARLYFKKGDLTKARELAEQGFALREAIHDREGLVSSMLTFAEMDTDRAAQLLSQAIGISREVGSMALEQKAYQQLQSYYAEQGNYEQAYTALQRLQALNDSLTGLEKQKAILDIQTRYETEKKEREIAEKELEIADQQLAIQQQQTQITLLGALLTIMFVFGLAYYNYYRSRKQAELQAAIIQEQQRGLEAVFTATEAERKRIAKDLHDGIGQQLSALKMGFDHLVTRQDYSDAAALNALIDRTAREARELSHQMMPRALTELGLVAAMEDTLHASLDHSGISFHFEHFNLRQTYGEQREVALYRVFQELINNVLKHANATDLQVQLYQNRDRLILLVEDDGKGISGESPDGHGLVNIKSRLKTFGGQLHLSPGPERGTVATVTLPVD